MQGGEGSGGKMECGLCPEESPTVYIDDTSRNLFTRKKDNFMFQHQKEVHDGTQAEFSAKVTNSFRDCLTRQVSEALYIRRSDTEVLNSKSEWHQPALFTVRNEIVRA